MGTEQKRLLREQISSNTGAGRLIWNISKYIHDQSPKNLTLLKSFTGIPSHTVNISKYNHVQRPKVLTLLKSFTGNPSHTVNSSKIFVFIYAVN